jgi:hypothetical protein
MDCDCDTDIAGRSSKALARELMVGTTGAPSCRLKRGLCWLVIGNGEGNGVLDAEEDVGRE